MQKNVISKTLVAVCLAIFGLNCGGTPQTTPHKLSSGKVIKVSGEGKTNFSNGGTALVLNYETDIPISDSEKLGKEIDEIWVDFQNEAEQAQVNSCVIRATHYEGNSMMRSGSGYGFIFEKRADGKWYRQDDAKDKK